MTATDERAATPFEAPDADRTAGRLRVRRQPKWIAAGLLAICLGGLGATVLYTEATQSTDVIVATRTVPRGEVIGPNDLRVVRVGNLLGVSHTDAVQLNTLVGQRALVDLPEGALVPAGGVGRPVLDQGQSQVGLKLAPGRIPTGELPQGTQVLLVPLADERAAAGGADTRAAGPPVPAIVLTPPAVGPDGVAILLDVRVETARAPEVAGLAATDRLVLVKEAGR